MVASSLAGCGGPDQSEDSPAEQPADAVVDISGTGPVGEMTAGSVASLVECRDWNGATEEQRLATIEDVREQQNREDAGVSEPELTDTEATELFDGACKPSYAQGFRLYKLYAQGAAFVTMKRALDEQAP